ncbi:DUF4381 domain-containing protein [Tropicimonas marinistellae]|uniref:DUF4381 domain-containing protein n=1 Tax=Tropicimonas marinistellae TaxID=1739787 RepID=UPI0008351292|nr:DUF4381 domain-containing protein [Tropicimonas marinistellae]
MADLPQTDGKNLVELLDMLKPIPEPAPISMWPATGGWIWLGLALALLIGWIAWRRWRHWQANAYRRAALAELQASGDDPAEIAAILRRTALVAYPRRDVASLTGGDWIAFLRERCPDMGIDSSSRRALTEGPYKPRSPDPALGLIAQTWVRRHRPEGARR